MPPWKGEELRGEGSGSVYIGLLVVFVSFSYYIPGFHHYLNKFPLLVKLVWLQFQSVYNDSVLTGILIEVRNKYKIKE